MHGMQYPPNGVQFRFQQTRSPCPLLAVFMVWLVVDKFFIHDITHQPKWGRIRTTCTNCYSTTSKSFRLQSPIPQNPKTHNDNECVRGVCSCILSPPDCVCESKTEPLTTHAHIHSEDEMFVQGIQCANRIPRPVFWNNQYDMSGH